MTRISIILPNLNNYPYLTARIESIFHQTFTDWELIIIDGYSDDNSWLLINQFAKTDIRIKAYQIPPQGVYQAINYGLDLAEGDYIYIATGDDTMSPEFLEVMVTGITPYSQWDICHCLLEIIDENGNSLTGWYEKMPPVKFYDEWMNKYHVRQAGYDGILYCALGTVYISLTQLLIRRNLFDKVGLFRTDLGAIADFEWGMRASLISSTLHIPKALATWRIHGQQVTNLQAYNSSKHQQKLMEMVQMALPILERYNPELYKQLNLYRLLFIYRRQYLRLGLKECHNYGQKVLFISHEFLAHPRFIFEFIYRRVFYPRNQNDDFNYIRQELERLGLKITAIDEIKQDTFISQII